MKSKNKLTVLYHKQNGLCAICGLPATLTTTSHGQPGALTATIDHIIPVSKGGTSHIKNLRMAHQRCNTYRGDGPEDYTLSGKKQKKIQALVNTRGNKPIPDPPITRFRPFNPNER